MIKLINESSNIVCKFIVGDTYTGSMLHGGEVYYKVIDRTSTTVILAESHISEDDLQKVDDDTEEYPIVLQNVYDDTYDNVIGKQEAVKIWEYKGHKGFLYSKKN